MSEQIETLVKGTDPNAEFFTEYVYSTEDNDLDVYIGSCGQLDKLGCFCESCYHGMLEQKMKYLSFMPSKIKMKRFLAYQVDLYEDSDKWLSELENFMQYGFSSEKGTYSKLIQLINECIREMKQVDRSSIEAAVQVFVNSFDGANIGQVNQGGNNSQTLQIGSLLDKMEADGFPKEIIEEGREILNDEDKSPTMRTIAAEWIKKLPFKVIEKAGDWALSNADKIQQTQDSLFAWYEAAV